MITELKAEDLYDEKNNYSFRVEIPNTCPICNKGIQSKIMKAYACKRNEMDEEGRASIIYECPVCEGFFIGEYQGDLYCYHTVNLVSIYPQMDFHKQINFSENIDMISEDFVRIYNQSYRAEIDGMNEICGMGYRKALEFLLKDFAIYIKPDEANKISKMHMMECIKQYYEEHSRIYTLAIASTWLGNDETHYKKKHESYDVKQLKLFIQALVTYIDSEVQYTRAYDFISSNQK